MILHQANRPPGTVIESVSVSEMRNGNGSQEASGKGGIWGFTLVRPCSVGRFVQRGREF